MSNNRLWLVVPPYDDEQPRRVLLAKGWSIGWALWKPDTLIKRLEAALDGADIAATTVGDATKVRIEDENSEGSVNQHNASRVAKEATKPAAKVHRIRRRGETQFYK